MHEGAVVLLHSTSGTNAEIMDELPRKWEEQGFRRFGEVSLRGGKLRQEYDVCVRTF